VISIRGFIRALGAQSPLGDELVIYFNYYLLRKRKLWFSISNSPYPAHVLRTAVDIYSEYPYLPVVRGVVKKIIRIPSGLRVRGSESDEWVIIISLPGGGDVLKVLHVRPSVRVGERLYLGDELGKFVRTYHFYPWTETHMHVELRNASDPVRALGGYRLFPQNELLSVLSEYQCTGKDEYKVISVEERFCLLRPVGGGYSCAQTSGLKGFLDGGLPHYGHASIFSVISDSQAGSGKIMIGEYLVGELISSGNYYLIFKPTATPIIAGDEGKGIGFFLMREEVKLVGNRVMHDLHVGDVVNVSWIIRSGMRINKYLELLGRSA